jgi:hypothetical protein
VRKLKGVKLQRIKSQSQIIKSFLILPIITKNPKTPRITLEF